MDSTGNGKESYRVFAVFAQAFRYPAPGRMEGLQAGLQELIDRPLRASYNAFLRKVSQLNLGEWEELYTRTFDLSPAIAPYVGFQTWGESYQRGNFMALMNRELNEYDIDLDGELPDHLVPVLRYLAVAPQPAPELVEILPPALQRMRAVLAKSDPGNPYIHLVDAVMHAARLMPAETH